MLLFVVVLLKRTIYNKETKREAENERRENKRSQSGHKKSFTADSAPDPKNERLSASVLHNKELFYKANNMTS